MHFGWGRSARRVGTDAAMQMVDCCVTKQLRGSALGVFRVESVNRAQDESHRFLSQHQRSVVVMTSFRSLQKKGTRVRNPRPQKLQLVYLQ